MPVNIPKNLPAREILEKENIFVMDQERASSQDIRPLNVLILNLMPEKERTERQLLRLLGNTPLQVNVTFLRTETYSSKNTSIYHLDEFYKSFSDVKDLNYDGFIITGAPVEHLDFEQVDYWEELKGILEWSITHVTSTLHICWGAQSALYFHYGIGKVGLPKKCSGVYEHRIENPHIKLMRGFNDIFHAPHSRHTDVSIEEIRRHSELNLVAFSPEAGPMIIASKNNRHIMVTGHFEYETDTLALEYQRDKGKGLLVDVPHHYFPDNDPLQKPANIWRSHAYLFFSNWLNYYVYQETPYHF